MINTVNATVTNSAAAVTMPNFQVTYLQIHNPDSAGSVAFTLDGSTPVVNGNGITLLPGGTETFDNPGGTTINANGLKMISSVASQKATILWGTP